MKFLVLVFTCKKYFNRLNAINTTWGDQLKQLNIPYYFVSGDEDIKQFDNSIFLDNFVECYEQLPLKTFHAFSESLKHSFDFLVKLDDDVYFNIDKFLKLDIKNFNYIGKFNKPNNSSNIHFFKCNDQYKKEKSPTEYEYAEGAFYCLSRNYIEKICSFDKKFFINTPETYRGEDVLVGSILRDAKKLDLNTDYSKKLNMDITMGGISLHPVHFSLYKELYKKSFEEQIIILKNNPLKNQYNLRDLYLKNLIK